MYELEDPLKNWEALEVTDIATARYALKIANDQHFAVIHMREHMERELARSRLEVTAQSMMLLEPYFSKYDEHGQLTSFGMGRIPDPLPSRVPAWIQNGIRHMNEQLAIERERAEAELADQCAPLLEIKAALVELVKAWFIAEVQANPDWLGHLPRATLGGCKMTYNGGDDVTFEFAELDYGD